MSQRSFRISLAIVIASIVIVLGVLGWMIHRVLEYPDHRHGGTGRIVEVEIKPGTSFPQAATLLADKGVLDHPKWFRILAMWRGETTNLKPAKYLIADNLTPSQVLKIVITGVKEVTIKVTLPEGENMLELFDKIGKACPPGEHEPCEHIASAKDLAAEARDKDFLAAHAITGDSVDGYLFPDTYEFRVGEKPRVVLDRLIQRHQEVWNELMQKHSRDVAKLKDQTHWTDREILILASIVEKEAVDPKERPRIAQVFINRMFDKSFKTHRLETDPTIRYGCEVPVQKSAACQAWNTSDRLHAAQLHDPDNPYNTYEHAGLPPGPISNPGRDSIEATLTPDGSDYLYFVAKDARNHVFARTYEEHKKNVDKYQR